MQLVWTQTRLLRRVEQLLASHDVTLPQFDVLANLRLREGLTQQELAARLQSTKGNVCGLIDRLEKLKWVERRPDPEDGRANRLYLTQAGRARVEKLRPLHDRMVLGLMKDLSDADLRGFLKVLNHLDQAADGDAAM